MAAITGRECMLCINTGTYASPTWLPVTIAKDVTVSRSVDKLEDNCRSAGAYKQYVVGTIDLSVDLEVCHRNLDDRWMDIESAIENGTTLDIMVLDGDHDATNIPTGQSAKGIRMVCNVFECENAQPLEDPLSDTYTFAPSADLNSNQLGPSIEEIEGTA